MKFFIKHIAILLSVVSLLLGCDEIKKDVVSITPVNTQPALWDIHTLYTAPSNMVTINVKDFLKNMTGHAIKIEKTERSEKRILPPMASLSYMCPTLQCRMLPIC
jgi:hypothetical protein